MKPKFCVLRTDGTNCDDETRHAIEVAGGIPELVHVNKLRNRSVQFMDFQSLILSGGFSYGDDVRSGCIHANELVSFFYDQLQEFVASGRPVMGICNGFQILVQSGLLPFGTIGKRQATLTHNTCGHFVCRFVELLPCCPCPFTLGIEGPMQVEVAHGEGRFKADETTLAKIEELGLIALRYSEMGVPTMRPPANPNGSSFAIAALCFKNVFGCMPHPERSVEAYHHPNWRREPVREPHGRRIFANAVALASQF